MAFFGLAQLDAASPDFRGICDYASSMTFELVTNATTAAPTADDVSVRFYFSNGTAAENPNGLFPLFGQDETTLKWSAFQEGMAKFAIEDTQHWCKTCGNNDGACASNSTDTTGDASSNSSGSGNGVSKPVAGVIGALVTLVVILGIQAAVLLFGGLRLAKKSTLAGGNAAAGTSGVKA
ncbi:hypothetical protein G7046_g8407 [Stylonectria norvegica]|nr:hypothetical protein G7046_g8407 [Stylonectria norvegica]